MKDRPIKIVLTILALVGEPFAWADVLPARTIDTVYETSFTQVQSARAASQTCEAPVSNVEQAIKRRQLARELLPVVKDAEKQSYDEAITQVCLADEIKPTLVTNEQVKARYDAIASTLGDQEYKARVIQLSDSETAMQVITQLKNGTDFSKLAQQYSIAANNDRGGELDWISFKVPVVEGRTQNIPLPVAREMAALQPGAFSTKPIVAGTLYYILKVEGIRPTRVPPYDAAKATIRHALEATEQERATVQMQSTVQEAATVLQ